MLKRFFLNSKNHNKDGFIYNTIGSGLVAFQSVIFLMVLNRTIGLYEAGVFTIANTLANLFLNVGKYGVRNFQVSDTKREYNFEEYKIHRFYSTLLMVFISIIYVVIVGSINNYALDKALCIIFMCLFKAVDSMEDVYYGHYQQQDRLDVAGKCLTIRISLSIITFVLGLIIFKNLLASLIVSFILSVLYAFIIINSVNKEFNINKFKENSNVIKIFKVCFPLFVATFLTQYINNAQKLVIDSMLSEDLQACYGFIHMPVFVIGLLSSFLYTPILTSLSNDWYKENFVSFKKQIKQQLIMVLILAAICLIGAYLIGIPALSLLYNCDLTDYKMDLLVLLLGGGFLACSGLLSAVLTVMSARRYIMIGYVLTSIAALILSPVFVSNFELIGASIIYTITNILLCIYLLTGYFVLLNKKQKKLF